MLPAIAPTQTPTREGFFILIQSMIIQTKSAVDAAISELTAAKAPPAPDA